jgi:UDP-MurNAc hydroxylase
VNITALGHAGLSIETDRSTVAIDPWFDPSGTFQASWFQFPENAHLVGPSLFEPTAVIVSHEHLDHVDPWFLARVPPSVPIVIPRYTSPALRGKIERSGSHTIVEVPHWTEFEIADGTRMFFVPELSPMNHDSAIVVRAEGQAVLDMNDARLSPDQLRSIRTMVGGTIDVFAFQGAGASWYPICYRFPEERRHELSRRKRLAKLSYAARCIGELEPRAAVPFAGPACFLDPALFRHNAEMDGGIFPDQREVAEWLSEHGVGCTVVLLPGDTWDAAARTKTCDPVWDGFDLADRWPYLEAYADRKQGEIADAMRRYPAPEDSLWEPFRAWFQSLLSMSPYFNGKIAMRVGFDIEGPGGGRWTVDFRPGSEGVSPGLEGCSHGYRFDARWLPPLLDGSVPWEDFFLSLRFEAWRDPDTYNDHLLGLLKFANVEALAAVEAYETGSKRNDRIVMTDGSRSYSVGRYCPHAGNDLSIFGEVIGGGIVRCLAHHYEFDLRTGRCLNGSVDPLDVEPLDAPIE